MLTFRHHHSCWSSTWLILAWICNEEKIQWMLHRQSLHSFSSIFSEHCALGLKLNCHSLFSIMRPQWYHHRLYNLLNLMNISISRIVSTKRRWSPSEKINRIKATYFKIKIMSLMLPLPKVFFSEKDIHVFVGFNPMASTMLVFSQYTSSLVFDTHICPQPHTNPPTKHTWHKASKIEEVLHNFIYMLGYKYKVLPIS